jgi:hypothetical protein
MFLFDFEMDTSVMLNMSNKNKNSYVFFYFFFCFLHELVHNSVVGCSSMTGYPLAIADSNQEEPGMEPVPLDWHTSTQTTELQDVMHMI